MQMYRKTLMIGLVLISFHLCPASFAYNKDYPPYNFKDGPPKHFKVEKLIDYDTSEYKSKNGDIYACLKDTNDVFNFIIKNKGVIITSLDKKELPLPDTAYLADVDGNGLKDFIVFSSYRGCGLAAFNTRVEIYLAKPGGRYQKISYDSLFAGIRDFVVMGKEGECQLIIPDFYYGSKHNYFTYSIYEFNNYRLINADKKYKGFPKFVWYTYKCNDRNAHLDAKERNAYVKKKDVSIQYEAPAFSPR